MIAPGFFFPEETISFNGVTVDSVVLSAPATLYFAIDNVDVQPVPKPATITLSPQAWQDYSGRGASGALFAKFAVMNARTMQRASLAEDLGRSGKKLQFPTIHAFVLDQNLFMLPA